MGGGGTLECRKEFNLFFFWQVQRSDPEHLFSQWHVPRPSANSLLCHKGKTVHDIG